MDKISAWCKFIALFSILSSTVLLILPESKSKKSFKLLLSFILIYSFITPLTEVVTDFNKVNDYFNFSVNSAVSESLKDYEYYPVISATESATEEYFNGVLSAIGVQGDCEAVCDIKESKVYLREIRIYAKVDENQRNMIAEEVSKIYGKETTIIFSGEQ